MSKRADILSDAILNRASLNKRAEQETGLLAQVLKGMEKTAQEQPPAPPEAPVPPKSADMPKVEDTVPPKDTVQEDKSGKTEEGVQQTPFISKELADLLNRQIGNEIYASYTYYAAFGWFDNKGLDGFAKYVDAQAKDEIVHAMKIFKFMNDSGLPVVLPAIPAPKAAYKDAREIVETIFKHEKGVTADWRAIGKKAAAEGDAASSELAQWFVTEQLEEEAKILGIHQRLKLDPGEMAVLMVDATLR